MPSERGDCFRFRLYSDKWDEVGEYETFVPNWSHGDEFLFNDGRRFRILVVVGINDDVGVFDALWKVEPVASRRDASPLLRQDGAVAPRAAASDLLARLVGAYASLVGLPQEMEVELVQTVSEAGFVYVPEDALGTPYTGNHRRFVGSTWWKRFFEYI